MNLIQNKDDSFLKSNKTENKPEKKNRKSNVSAQNRAKVTFDISTPKRIKKVKTISKFNNEKRQSMNKSNGNILNDYLHSHKFDIQRKKTRRKTCRNQNNDNNFLLNMNKSYMNNKDNMTMIYYPNDKKIKHKVIKNPKSPKNENVNLNIVENSLMLKLNSMRNNFQNDTTDNRESFDNFFDNYNFANNRLSTRSSKNVKRIMNKSNKSINIANKNSKGFSQNLFMNNNFKNNDLGGSYGQNNNLVNNDKKLNLSLEKSFKNENLNNSINKSKSSLIDTHHKKYNDEIEKIKYSQVPKKSSQSLNVNNELRKKEKYRYLSRIKPLYDSFDDDESEKDEDNEGNCIYPSSLIVFIMDFFLFICSIYSLFYIPLRMAKSDCFCEKESIINVLLLYFIDILYIGDFCIGFFKAYYNFQFKIIKNNKKIILHYLKTDGFIDFLESIPFFTINKFLCKAYKDTNYCFKFSMSNSLLILKISTNLKIFKIFKVRNKRKNMSFTSLFYLLNENYFIEKLINNLLNFSFCFLALHFFICLNIFLSKQTYPNWLVTHHSETSDFLHNYIISSYSLIETLTTVGYGDVVCQSNIERIFQIFFLGVGVIAYSYLISSFGNLFKNQSQSSINYSNNMKILEEIRVDYPKMPYKLYNKIYNYIESRNISEKKSDADILTNSLPFNLKNALLLIMYRNDIKNFKIFQNCENSNFIIEILSNFVPSTSKKSEFLVYEGEMIEDIIIIKDGRLSLEAAIDMENPQSSIRNYFNVNFQGITTEKEIRKINEKKKESTTQLIQSKKTSDFENVKSILNTAVKKQANLLLNEACDETSILDRTRNDNPNETQNERIFQSLTDHLKNEPIRNEKGNFKYIKILDIRKNENYGGLYIFMRRPSPLSLKVRSKFAELYLLPKKEVFNIAKNYRNIWSKIHRKDFHNMLSIKHHTFNILNKYIEINGIGKISPNDVSGYVYPWEYIEKKNKNLKFVKTNEINDTKDTHKFSDKQYLYFKNTSTPKNDQNPINLKNKIFSNKSNDKIIFQTNKDNKQMPIETDFSHLLTLAINERQKNNNQNTNSNTNISAKENNLFKNKNNTYNSNEDNNSSKSFASNFFDNKQKTKGSEDGKTFIIPKNSERLMPTLNNIFNENKAQKIKEEIKKTRKKEHKKKIISFVKKTAKIFKNENYSIYLVGKTTNECIEIKNKNNLSSKSLVHKDMDIYDYVSFCQDKLFLDKISEINSSEEESLHLFHYKDLSKEAVTSFSFESIYENINIHSKMKYSQDKLIQQKVLNYITKLIEEKNNKLSLSSSLSDSLDVSKSNSFSNPLSNNNYEKKNSNHISINIVESQGSSNSNLIINPQKFGELSIEVSKFKSDNSKKSSQSEIFGLNKEDYISLKSNNREPNGENIRYKSMKPRKIKFDADKSKKNPSHFKNNDKLTIKFDSRNEFNSELDCYNSNIKSKDGTQKMPSQVMHKNTNYLNLNPKKTSQFLLSDNATKTAIINNIKTIKNQKNRNKLSLISKKVTNISDKKSQNKRSSIKGKLTKKYTKRKTKQNKTNQQSHKFKSEQKLIKIEKGKDTGGIANSMAYFAKEENGREDCIII